MEIEFLLLGGIGIEWSLADKINCLSTSVIKDLYLIVYKHRL